MVTLTRSLTTILLVLLSASPFFCSTEEGVIEEIFTTTDKPFILSYGLAFLHAPYPRYEVDKCLVERYRDQLFKHTFEDNLDIRKMMGRWFEGLVDPGYHRSLSKGHKCMVYEFGRLIMAHHTTSFDVTITYKLKSNIEKKDFGYVTSSEPRNAMLALYSTNYPNFMGTKFWIYKLGPEGKDSIGRMQYEYAIVAGCYLRQLVVLTRNPEVFKEKYKTEVLDWLKAHDYEISPGNPIVQPSYFECYYDSVSQTEGY